MANPTPIYRVKFDGSYLSGYAQSDAQPLGFKTTSQNALNRNGGSLKSNGADVRKITLEMRILSRLGSGSSGLDHLNDCKAQYRDSLKILARAGEDPAALYIGDMTRFTYAVVTNVSGTFQANSSRALTYNVAFDVEPFYQNDTESTATFAADGTVTIALTDTRETYPTFTIPSTVTAFVATHTPTGKIVDFSRGSFGSTIVVDCSSFTVLQGATDASSTMNNINFGIKHTTGAGNFSVDITGYAGSGNVTVGIRERYEL